jgi:hypothetical protein
MPMVTCPSMAYGVRELRFPRRKKAQFITKIGQWFYHIWFLILASEVTAGCVTQT